MSKFNIPQILGEAMENLRAVARHPEILAVMAVTQAGCNRDPYFEDASSVPAKTCAGDLEESGGDNGWPSENMELAELGEVGYTHLVGDGNCVVKVYMATNPKTSEPLDQSSIVFEITHHLVALAYPNESSWGTSMTDGYMKTAYLSSSCTHFDEVDPYGGNLCVAVCPEPEWNSESRVIFTDTCEEIVYSNNQSYDLISGIPEHLQMSEAEREAAIEAKYGHD